MSNIKYYSATELMEKAGGVMIPLKNQLPAQRQIASIIAMHLCKIQALNRGASVNEVVSVSAFLAGSTGSGKSYIIKSLAEICGLHFRQVDCTSISQTGVRGKTIAHCLSEIEQEDRGFFKEGGIMNLDEVDKTFYKNDPHYDAYSPQQDFLKLLEGGRYTYTVGDTTRTVNLDKTLFLLSGACSGITKILKRKHCKQAAIGFFNENSPVAVTDVKDYGAMITLEDLTDYGMMAELASRVNTVIHIPKIDLDGYKMLLTAEAKSSATNKFRNLFAMRGVQLDITAEAVDVIAAECVSRDVGARSVQAILNENLLDGYRIADENSECNRISLCVSDEGRILLNYYTGERISVPNFRRSYEEENFSLVRECSGEEEISQFADEMTQCACIGDITDERLVYYFLQTVCRYMKDEVRPVDRCFASILKLAEATASEVTADDYLCPFDIVCNDFMKKLEKVSSQQGERRVQLTVFQHYYGSFRRESRKRPGMHRVLMEALKTAGRLYIFPDRKLPTT